MTNSGVETQEQSADVIMVDKTTVNNVMGIVLIKFSTVYQR